MTLKYFHETLVISDIQYTYLSTDLYKTKSDGGYGNFTNKVANVERGTTNTIVISAEFRSLSYLEYWKVWIDFNQDGTFSDSEEVV